MTTNEVSRQPLSKRDLLSRLVPPQLTNEKALSGMEILLKEEEFDPNFRIIIQGQPGDKMYFISEGDVEIVSRGAFAMGRPERLAVLKAGDLFGEMAIVLNRPRSADVVALTPVKAFSLSSGDWQHMKAFFPGFAVHVEEIAARRVGINK